MQNKTFYNEILTEHNRNPYHKHPLKVVDLMLEGVNPSCGDDIFLNLKMNGDVIVNFLPLIELLQGSFCKYIIQNTQSDDMMNLSLSLRVIFNLFQNLKSFLKVQLEVFFTSVHIRLADMSLLLLSLTASQPTSTHEFLPKEAALESLLDFCQEPTVMIDLYTNVATASRPHT